MIARDRSAVFAGIVRRHQPYFTRLAFSRVRSADVADDLVQLVLAGMWRTYLDLDGGDKPFLIYAATAIRHASIGRTVRARRWRFADVDIAAFAAESTPHDLYERAEVRAALRKAMAALPPKQRAPLALVLDGATYEDAARTLGTTVDAVHDRLRLARENLRALMTSPPGVASPRLAGVEPPAGPNVAALARELGVKYATVHARIRKGWSPDEVANGRPQSRRADEGARFRRAFDAAPGAFTPRERAAVAAYYFEGASVAESAGRLGTTSTAIASTLYHARKTLVAHEAGRARTRTGRNRAAVRIMEAS